MAKKGGDFDLKRGAPEAINRLPGVRRELGAIAARIAGRLTEGTYVAGVSEGETRSRGFVVTGDIEAVIDNSANDSLLRALDAEEGGV